MNLLKGMIGVRTESGQPVVVEGVKVTLRSQSLVIRSRVGAFVWNRPTNIIVEREGRTERIPISDFTRIVQLALAGLATIILVMARIRQRRRKE